MIGRLITRALIDSPPLRRVVLEALCTTFVTVLATKVVETTIDRLFPEKCPICDGKPKGDKPTDSAEKPA